MDPDDLERAADEGGEAPCFSPFLDQLDLRDDAARRSPVIVDLDAVAPRSHDGGALGDGVAWHLPHDGDLDANLVRLGAHGAIGEHRNGEVDVLIVVRSGSADLWIDGERHALTPGALAMVPIGARRSIAAGAGGVAYLSIHRRRAGLSIGPARAG